MADLAKVGDPVTCPKCGPNQVATGSPTMLLDYHPVAIVGVSKTECGATIISGLSWFNIDDCHAAVQGSMHSHGGVVLASSTAKTGSPRSFGTSGVAPLNLNRVEHGGMGYEYSPSPLNPELKGGLIFVAEPDRSCVFAKSCDVPRGSVQAGTGPEPISNFGKAAVMGSTAVISSDGGATLGRVAGQSVLDALGSWSLRGVAAAAGTAVSTLALALWPSELGDGALYTDEELARLSAASTRVRFQFRKDSQGTIQVYGIHTSATSGMDTVPVVQANWDANHQKLEAHAGGITITWTPNEGPIATAPTTYPGVTDELEKIMVHPIAPDTDSQIETYPASDDITWQDFIFTFPKDSGLPPLYLVFAKPMVNPLEVGAYSDLSTRSKKDSLDIDHIPSRKALEKFIRKNFPEMMGSELKIALQQAPSIAISARIHQKYSETYGGRNTEAKQMANSLDLRTAVDSNFDAIKTGLLEEGFTDNDIEAARRKLHELHSEQGWYK